MLYRRLLVCLFLLPALARAAALRTQDLASPGPHRTLSQSLTLHDQDRNKDLPLSLVYPDGPGALPVIVFSHGAGGSGQHYRALADHWASHGYVVLSPTHADSLSLRKPPVRPAIDMRDVILKAARDTQGWQNRAKDVLLCIDSLSQIEQRVPALKGKLDAKHLAVAGHSYGAATSMLLGGATADFADGAPRSFADPRIQAILVLSGQGPGQLGFHEHSWDNLKLPMMVMTGSLDRGIGAPSAEWRTEPFRHAPAPDKYLVFIQGAAHSTFSGRLATTADEKRLLSYVQAASLAFFNAYLRSDAPAQTYLRSDTLPADSQKSVQLDTK